MYHNDYIEKTIGYHAGQRILDATDFTQDELERTLRILVDTGVPPQLLVSKVYATAELSTAYNTAPDLCAKAIGYDCVAQHN